MSESVERLQEKNKTITELDSSSYEAFVERIKKQVSDGHISPELASLFMAYYALGRYEASGEYLNPAIVAREEFGVNYREIIGKFQEMNADVVFSKRSGKSS